MKDDIRLEQELERAAEEAFSAMLADLPSPEAWEHDFSPAFEEKMDRLLTKSRRSPSLRRFGRRAAMVALTCLVGAGSLMAFSTDARATLASWIKTQYESFMSFQFSGDLSQQAPPMLPQAELRPVAIPADYTESGWSRADEQMVVEYINESSQLLSFGYIPESDAGEDPWSGVLSTDGMAASQVQVSGQPACLYTRAEENSILMWSDPRYGLRCFLSAPLSDGELIDAAESVRVVNADDLPDWEPGQPLEFEPLYVLQLSEEYLPLEVFGDDQSCWAMYLRLEQGDTLSFQSFYTHSGLGMSLALEEENYTCESIQVGELSGEFYRAKGDSPNNALLLFDQRRHVGFYLYGPNTRDELVSMAEGITRTR